MNQATLDFDPQADACDRTGFELGWDHARHGLVPPPGLLLDGTPIGQGWRAGKAIFGRRTLNATRPVRRWLTLRTDAWRRGIAFDSARLGANELARLDGTHCPVTRRPLGGAPGGADAPVVARLQPGAGYGIGHLVLLSAQAEAAQENLSAGALLRRAAQVDAGLTEAPGGLNPAETWRLAVLASLATPLPFAEAVRVPLRVLPTPQLRLVNAVQQLQALVTLQFAQPGWSERIRRLAALLPPERGEAPRHDFQLLAGAIAARVMEARPGDDLRAMQRALEDAWADARVNRRWQTFALALGEAGVQALLDRVTGGRTLPAAPARPADGWTPPIAGRVPAARSLRLVAPPRPRRGGAAAAQR